MFDDRVHLIVYEGSCCVKVFTLVSVFLIIAIIHAVAQHLGVSLVCHVRLEMRVVTIHSVLYTIASSQGAP